VVNHLVSKTAKFAMTLVLVMGFTATAFAQTPPPNGEGSSRSGGGPRKQLATIIFAGLGGAVLGLSTLSFYGRPQDNLSNIAIGFAVGVIVGTTYVTYTAATNPAAFYGINGASAQAVAALESTRTREPVKPPTLGLTFQF
jgi:hypothetical protein